MTIKIAAAAVLAAGTLLAGAGTASAAGGCGPGFHPNPWGHCRPNLGPRWGYGPRFVPAYRYGYGPRWGAYRHVGWGHRGWGHGGWHHRW